MPRALFLRCLLALALVVQGLPAFAMDAHAHEAATVVAPADDAGPSMPACHGDDAAPAPADFPDCCDDGGGDCGCDCLHASSLFAMVRGLPGVSPPAGGPPVGLVPAAASSAPLPSLRPPIA